MKKPAERLFVLLALSRMTEQELHRSIEFLRKRPTRATMEAIQELRKELDKAVRHSPVLQRLYGYDPSRMGPDLEPLSRIEHLLRVEAGLTVREAATKLIEMIAERSNEESRDLRPPNRVSFYNWLLKVSKRVSTSMLLHHATVIRNRYVHDDDTDWPLRGS